MSCPLFLPLNITQYITHPLHLDLLLALLASNATIECTL